MTPREAGRGEGVTGSPQALGEPVIGVQGPGIRRSLDVSVLGIEGAGLDEIVPGIQPHGRGTQLTRRALGSPDQPRTTAQPTQVVTHEHPLDFGGVGLDQLHTNTTRRATVVPRQQEHPRRKAPKPRWDLRPSPHRPRRAQHHDRCSDRPSRRSRRATAPRRPGRTPARWSCSRAPLSATRDSWHSSCSLGQPDSPAPRSVLDLLRSLARCIRAHSGRRARPCR